MKVNIDFIKEKRKEKGLTLKEMAEKLNYKNASTYYKYENGIYEIDANMLPLLSKILECEIGDFFV